MRRHISQAEDVLLAWRPKVASWPSYLLQCMGNLRVLTQESYYNKDLPKIEHYMHTLSKKLQVLKLDRPLPGWANVISSFPLISRIEMKLGSSSEFFSVDESKRLPESLRAICLKAYPTFNPAADMTSLLRILPSSLEELVIPDHPVYWDRSIPLPKDLIRLEIATLPREPTGHLFETLPPSLTTLVNAAFSDRQRTTTLAMPPNLETPWKKLPRNITKLSVFFEGPFPEPSLLPAGLEHLTLLSLRQSYSATDDIKRSYLSTLRCLREFSLGDSPSLPLSLVTDASLPLPPSLSKITLCGHLNAVWSSLKNLPASVKEITFSGYDFPLDANVILPPHLTAISGYLFHKLDQFPEELLSLGFLLNVREAPQNLKLPSKLTSLLCPASAFNKEQAFSVLPHTLTMLRLVEFGEPQYDLIRENPNSSKTLPPNIKWLEYAPSPYQPTEVDTTEFVLNLSPHLPLTHLKLGYTRTDWEDLREGNPNFAFWPDLVALAMVFSSWDRSLFQALPRRLASLELFFPYDESLSACREEDMELLPISISANKLKIDKDGL